MDIILTGTNCTYKSTLAGLIEPRLQGSVVYPSSTVLVRNGWSRYQDDPGLLDGPIEDFQRRLLPHIDLAIDGKNPNLETCMQFGRDIYARFKPEEVADAHKWFADNLYPHAPSIIFEGIRYAGTVRRLKETTGAHVIALKVSDDEIADRLVSAGIYSQKEDAMAWVKAANAEYGFREVEEELADEVHSTQGMTLGDLGNLAEQIAQRLTR